VRKLDLILNLPDKKVRLRELELLASSLGMRLDKIYSAGRISEEALVIHIYDALKAREQRASRALRFSLIICGGCLAGLLILFQARQMIFRQRELDIAQKEYDQKAFTGQDGQGETITEGSSKRAVRFTEMEGVYDQFDDDGHLLYQLEYKDGLLRRKRKFDREGRIITEILIDEKGKATLAK